MKTKSKEVKRKSKEWKRSIVCARKFGKCLVKTMFKNNVAKP